MYPTSVTSDSKGDTARLNPVHAGISCSKGSFNCSASCQNDGDVRDDEDEY